MHPPSQRPAQTRLFPIVTVPSAGAGQAEPMGTKYKFWYEDEHLGKCLFKESRRGHGEDWAEKAAQELAALLGAPHAHFELAVFGEKLRVVSPTFVRSTETLVHGNELIVDVNAQYAAFASTTRSERTSRYTVDLVLSTLEQSGARPRPEWALPDGVTDGVDVLVGYLMIDAWIGNTDRHHENWAIVEAPPGADGGSRERFVAPLYDSASCLGRNEPDEKRRRRLTTRCRAAGGRRAVATHARHAERARSRALMLRTAEPPAGNIYTVGFCPRYLTRDVLALLQAALGARDGGGPARVSVGCRATNGASIVIPEVVLA